MASLMRRGWQIRDFERACPTMKWLQEVQSQADFGRGIDADTGGLFSPAL
jgi:hypothetical protein